MARWIDKAREVAMIYPKNKQELGRLRRYVRKPRAAVPSVGRGLSRPVEAEVVAVSDDARIGQLEREIAAVEWAFSALEKMRDVPKAQEVLDFADLCYRKGGHTVGGCARVLFISPETAWRRNRIFLRLVAARMGFLPNK